MSLFVEEQKEGSTRRASVNGKVSIGIPTDEIVLITGDYSRLIGKTIRKGKAGVPDGMILARRHIEMLLKEGETEIEIDHGGFPERLDYIRVWRRADSDRSRFVFDPKLHRSLGVDEKPRSIPIVLPINSIEKMAGGGMRNYDRTQNKLFCCSTNPPLGVRAIVDNGVYTGNRKEVQCVPTYGHAAEFGAPICKYRNKRTKAGRLLPCKPNFTFYFNVLTKNPESFDLGSFYKFETTSIESGMNIMATLEAVQKRFGHVDWIPMELEVIQRKKVTPDGPTSKVPIMSLGVPTRLLREYADTIKSIKEILDVYSLTDDIIIEDEINEEAFDAEFRPEVRNLLREREGQTTGSGHSFQKRSENVINSDPSERAAMDASAMKLPPDKYAHYVSRRDTIQASKFRAVIAYHEEVISGLSEEEINANFNLNSQNPVPQK